MEYTAKQIERAKVQYNAFMVYRTFESFEPEYIGHVEANNRCDYHNNLVREIANGNKESEKNWKMFFITEVVRADRKAAESVSKKTANKEASADILAPVKAMKKIVEFGKWLNTSGNEFRKEHFSKKYTQESVTAFLNQL